MKSHGMLIFEILALILIAWFVLEAFNYNERARLLPLVIGIPTFLLLLIQTALDNIPGLAKYRSGSLKLVDIDQAKKANDEDPLDEKVVVNREVKALAWVIGLGLGLTLLGYYLVIPVFLVLFLRYVGKLKWQAVAISTLITCLLLYGAFVGILGIDFYPGMLLGR